MAIKILTKTFQRLSVVMLKLYLFVHHGKPETELSLLIIQSLYHVIHYRLTCTLNLTQQL